MTNKLVIASIAAFVAVDVVLAVAAVQHVRGGAPEGDAISVPTPVGDSTTEPSLPSQSPTSTQPSEPSTPAETSVPAAERSLGLLSIGIDGTILRATAGNCRSDKTGKVEVSTDGGATFETVFPDVPQVLRVVAVSRSDLWFVGTDESCAPSVERSGDTGASWIHSQGTAGAYHLSASENPSLVHAPGGRVTVGCATVGIAALDTEVAFVGCDDGTIRRTGDGGQTFESVGHVDGLVSLTFRDAQTGFALASQSGCQATALRTDDAGKTWKFAACVRLDIPKAIATNADKLVAQVGADILVSDDDGQTWVPAG